MHIDGHYHYATVLGMIGIIKYIFYKYSVHLHSSFSGIKFHNRTRSPNNNLMNGNKYSRYLHKILLWCVYHTE